MEPAVGTVINQLAPSRTLFGVQQQITTSGSGVVIDPSGHILTNNNVVEGGLRLEIILADGSSQPATLVGLDPFADLALIQVQSDLPTPAERGNSNSIKPGCYRLAPGRFQEHCHSWRGERQGTHAGREGRARQARFELTPRLFFHTPKHSF